MKTFKILVPDAHQRDLEVERSVSGERFDYVVFDETDPRNIPDQHWADCDAVLVWHRMRISRETVGLLTNCKLIVRVGVGFDIVDVAACREAGIAVSNVPSYGTTEVADHALALLLHLVRGIGIYERRLKADPINGFVAEDAPVVRRIRGATFGAIGMGRIGTAVSRRAAGFDMNVIYYDPYLPEGHELGIGFERKTSLNALLAASDIVSLHVPLTETTRMMVNDDLLARFRDDSILINVARGALVDVDAVERALRSGKLAAVGLDVLPQEPPEPLPRLLEAWRDDEDWLAGRLVVTPHAAFYSRAGYHNMRTISTEILLDFLVEKSLRNNVNPVWEIKEAYRSNL